MKSIFFSFILSEKYIKKKKYNNIISIIAYLSMYINFSRFSLVGR